VLGPSFGLICARERPAEHTLVEISAELAADLALLTDALDTPGADISEAVRRFAIDAGQAVQSYVGLTVFTTGIEPQFTFSLMADGARHHDVRASLTMPLNQMRRADVGTDVTVVLFATKEGAFVDLAADLAWILGSKLSDIAVDEHLVADGRGTVESVTAQSVINQTLCVLLGRGMTPERAYAELDVQAAAAGTDRHAVAARILIDLTDLTEGPDC